MLCEVEQIVNSILKMYVIRRRLQAILWNLDDATPYGIHLYISDRCIKMPLIQNVGVTNCYGTGYSWHG
jgi:hypothetical protein